MIAKLEDQMQERNESQISFGFDSSTTVKPSQIPAIPSTNSIPRLSSDTLPTPTESPRSSVKENSNDISKKIFSLHEENLMLRERLLQSEQASSQFSIAIASLQAKLASAEAKLAESNEYKVQHHPTGKESSVKRGSSLTQLGGTLSTLDESRISRG